MLAARGGGEQLRPALQLACLDRGPPGIEQPINDQALEQFAAMPGVTAVIARDWVNGGMMLSYGRLEGWGSIMGLGTDDAADLGVTAEGGTLTLSKGTAVIGAMVPQQFFDPRVRPGQEPPPPPDLLDQTLKVTLIKYSNDGVEIRKVTLPVAAGRNLAVLTEAAVRNYVLQQRGVDSTDEFIARQAQHLQRRES